MQEPKLHGTAQPYLPNDHWLLQHWPEHDEGSDELSCSKCGHAVYSRRRGTVNTWVETGLVAVALDDDGNILDTDAMIYCLHCFAHMDYSQPVMKEWYHLHDDGTPQLTDVDGNPVPGRLGRSAARELGKVRGDDE